MKTENNIITYKDVSLGIKIGVVGGWISLISFIAGMAVGLFG